MWRNSRQQLLNQEGAERCDVLTKYVWPNLTIFCELFTSVEKLIISKYCSMPIAKQWRMTWPSYRHKSYCTCVSPAYFISFHDKRSVSIEVEAGFGAVTASIQRSFQTLLRVFVARTRELGRSIRRLIKRSEGYKNASVHKKKLSTR
jgi:hypothetical protein